jgi:hypothetical protein
MTLVIMAAVFVLAGVILSFSEPASPAGIRRSLLLGVAIWVPYVLYLKWICRKNTAFYAEINVKGLWRMTFQEQMRGLLISIPPILVLAFVLPWLTEGHGLSSAGPMLAVFGILSVVAYPEQKAIWLAAKARVAQMEESEGQE